MLDTALVRSSASFGPTVYAVRTQRSRCANVVANARHRTCAFKRGPTVYAVRTQLDSRATVGLTVPAWTLNSRVCADVAAGARHHTSSHDELPFS